MSRIVQLKYASVEFTEWGCETTFCANRECRISSWPHYDDPHYTVIAHRCGYSDDLLRYCQEHDVLHHLVMEVLFDRPSTVLWMLANEQEPEAATSVPEETMVLVAQRWIRANEEPIIGNADWHLLKRTALLWLGGMP